jgi:hypothetical protein
MVKENEIIMPHPLKEHLWVRCIGFEIFEENEIMMPHPLNEHLGVGCIPNWYQSTTTTLGQPGLMHDSYENIFKGL